MDDIVSLLHVKVLPPNSSRWSTKAGRASRPLRAALEVATGAFGGHLKMTAPSIPFILGHFSTLAFSGAVIGIQWNASACMIQTEREGPASPNHDQEKSSSRWIMFNIQCMFTNWYFLSFHLRFAKQYFYHCTMELSRALRISKITKNYRPRFCSIMIKIIGKC